MSKAVPSVTPAGLVGSSNACNSRGIGVIPSWKFLKPSKHTLFAILCFQRWHFLFHLGNTEKKEVTGLVMFSRLPTPDSECRYGFTEKRVFKQGESSLLLKVRNYQFKWSSHSTMPPLHSKCDTVSVHSVPQRCWGLTAACHRRSTSRWTRQGPKHTGGLFFSFSRCFLQKLFSV